MSSYNAFFGKITIDADNSDIVVDTVSVTLDLDDYYMYSPTAAESLLDVLCDAITVESTASVTYDISESGILTLSSASAFALSFSSPLYLALGFDSYTMSGEITYTAESQMQYCWFPEQLQSSQLSPMTSAGKMTPVINQQQASDKNVWTTKYGEIVAQELGYRYIPLAKAWEASTPTNASWEEFFSTTYSYGRKMLFIPYWSDDETNAWYYVADLNAEPSPPVTASITGSDTYWDISMFLLEVDA